MQKSHVENISFQHADFDPNAAPEELLAPAPASGNNYANLPNLVLSSTAKRRQRDIFENIPDALDLLTVCVEAGLSLERALVKVSGEIHIKSVVLLQNIEVADNVR